MDLSQIQIGLAALESISDPKEKALKKAQLLRMYRVNNAIFGKNPVLNQKAIGLEKKIMEEVGKGYEFPVEGPAPSVFGNSQEEFLQDVARGYSDVQNTVSGLTEQVRSGGGYLFPKMDYSKLEKERQLAATSGLPTSADDATLASAKQLVAPFYNTARSAASFMSGIPSFLLKAGGGAADTVARMVDPEAMAQAFPSVGSTSNATRGSALSAAQQGVYGTIAPVFEDAFRKAQDIALKNGLALSDLFDTDPTRNTQKRVAAIKELLGALAETAAGDPEKLMEAYAVVKGVAETSLASAKAAKVGMDWAQTPSRLPRPSETQVAPAVDENIAQFADDLIAGKPAPELPRLQGPGPDPNVIPARAALEDVESPGATPGLIDRLWEIRQKAGMPDSVDPVEYSVALRTKLLEPIPGPNGALLPPTENVIRARALAVEQAMTAKAGELQKRPAMPETPEVDPVTVPRAGMNTGEALRDPVEKGPDTTDTVDSVLERLVSRLSRVAGTELPGDYVNALRTRLTEPVVGPEGPEAPGLNKVRSRAMAVETAAQEKADTASTRARLQRESERASQDQAFLAQVQGALAPDPKFMRFVQDMFEMRKPDSSEARTQLFGEASQWFFQRSPGARRPATPAGTGQRRLPGPPRPPPAEAVTELPPEEQKGPSIAEYQANARDAMRQQTTLWEPVPEAPQVASRPSEILEQKLNTLSRTNREGIPGEPVAQNSEAFEQVVQEARDNLAASNLPEAARLATALENGSWVNETQALRKGQGVEQLSIGELAPEPPAPGQFGLSQMRRSAPPSGVEGIERLTGPSRTPSTPPAIPPEPPGRRLPSFTPAPSIEPPIKGRLPRLEKKSPELKRLIALVPAAATAYSLARSATREEGEEPTAFDALTGVVSLAMLAPMDRDAIRKAFEKASKESSTVSQGKSIRIAMDALPPGEKLSIARMTEAEATAKMGDPAILDYLLRKTKEPLALEPPKPLEVSKGGMLHRFFKRARATQLTSESRELDRAGILNVLQEAGVRGQELKSGSHDYLYGGAVEAAAWKDWVQKNPVAALMPIKIREDRAFTPEERAAYDGNPEIRERVDAFTRRASVLLDKVDEAKVFPGHISSKSLYTELGPKGKHWPHVSTVNVEVDPKNRTSASDPSQVRETLSSMPVDFVTSMEAYLSSLDAHLNRRPALQYLEAAQEALYNDVPLAREEILARRQLRIQAKGEPLTEAAQKQYDELTEKIKAKAAKAPRSIMAEWDVLEDLKQHTVLRASMGDVDPHLRNILAADLADAEFAPGEIIQHQGRYGVVNRPIEVIGKADPAEGSPISEKGFHLYDVKIGDEVHKSAFTGPQLGLLKALGDPSRVKRYLAEWQYATRPMTSVVEFFNQAGVTEYLAFSTRAVPTQVRGNVPRLALAFTPSQLADGFRLWQRKVKGEWTAAETRAFEDYGLHHSAAVPTDPAYRPGAWQTYNRVGTLGISKMDEQMSTIATGAALSKLSGPEYDWMPREARIRKAVIEARWASDARGRGLDSPLHRYWLGKLLILFKMPEFREGSQIIEALKKGEWKPLARYATAKIGLGAAEMALLGLTSAAAWELMIRYTPFINLLPPAITRREERKKGAFNMGLSTLPGVQGFVSGVEGAVNAALSVAQYGNVDISKAQKELPRVIRTLNDGTKLTAALARGDTETARQHFRSLWTYVQMPPTMADQAFRNYQAALTRLEDRKAGKGKKLKDPEAGVARAEEKVGEARREMQRQAGNWMLKAK